MDLDVEVSKLKLMKADHKSKQYRLEDQLLKFYPRRLKSTRDSSRDLRQIWKRWPLTLTPRMGLPGWKFGALC